MLRFIKTPIAMLIGIMLSMPAIACWYNSVNYNDYIYSVNNFERHAEIAQPSTSESGPVTSFTVQNNMTVDFPMTIFVKLISNSKIILADDEPQKAEILRCLLQYRVLPGGSWTTVAEYAVPTGTIPSDALPAPYFGRNNIWPKNCKTGDVIMIRLYVTDGTFQTGQLASYCVNKLTMQNSGRGNGKITLPDQITYDTTVASMIQNDLGGGWLPQYVMTVIWSGKVRPVQ